MDARSGRCLIDVVARFVDVSAKAINHDVYDVYIYIYINLWLLSGGIFFQYPFRKKNIFLLFFQLIDEEEFIYIYIYMFNNKMN